MKKPGVDIQPASKYQEISENTPENEQRKSNTKPRQSEKNKPCINKPNSEKRNSLTSKFHSKHKSKLHKSELPIYAALDLGTNNCRLLVAKPTRRGFLVIDAFSRIIRLGEGLSLNSCLSEAAMARTIEALKVCSSKMVRREVQRSRLVATEACRIANNSAEFIDRVKSETGLKLEIISRETEAKLAVAGCASLLDKKCDWALVFDIGGGSSEIIWLDLSKQLNKPKARRSLHDRIEAQNCITGWTSLPIGVVRLAEKFGGHEVNSETFEAMVSDVLQAIMDFESQHRISERLKGKNIHFLGTSGTVTTVAGIHLGLQNYDRNKVDGIWMHEEDVRKVSERLINMSYSQRVAEPCIGSGRADLVLAGCAILEALMRVWPTERLRVADRGLREGILSVLMADDRVIKR